MNNKKEDVVYENCVLAIKSVSVAGAYLNRVRVWAKDGTLLVAMRMLSSHPYTRGMFIKMQPDMPPAVAKALKAIRDAEAAAIDRGFVEFDYDKLELRLAAAEAKEVKE